jgi:hypothetical protein
MEENKIALRGVTITKEALEERYAMKLTDAEWKVFSSKLMHSWGADEEALRKLVFGHIKKSLTDIGFKLEITDTGLSFKKVD